MCTCRRSRKDSRSLRARTRSPQRSALGPPPRRPLPRRSLHRHSSHEHRSAESETSRRTRTAKAHLPSWPSRNDRPIPHRRRARVVSVAGLRRRADDEDRTRALSLGSSGELGAVGSLTCGRARSSSIVTLIGVLLFPVVPRSTWHVSGTGGQRRGAEGETPPRTPTRTCSRGTPGVWGTTPFRYARAAIARDRQTSVVRRLSDLGLCPRRSSGKELADWCEASFFPLGFEAPPRLYELGARYRKVGVAALG